MINAGKIEILVASIAIVRNKKAVQFCGIIRRGVYYKAVEIILCPNHPYFASI